MSEELKKVRTLLSDPKVLHKIKFIQFKRQLIPLLVVMLLMGVNILSPMKWLIYPALAAFAWYLLERVLLRTKNKIAEPETNAFVCPVDGKVQAVRKGEDMTSITIRKSWLDIAELRLPWLNLEMEKADSWLFNSKLGQLRLKIKAARLHIFEHIPVHGGVIGIIIGSGIITLYLPAGIKVLVKEGETVFGGETVLCHLDEAAGLQEQPASILVEEPMDETDKD